MKKLIICFILISAAAVAGFSATEEVQVYEFLYNASPTHSGQLDILQNMAESRLSGAGEFYAKALRKLVSEYRNIKDVTERNAADEQAMLLSALLGAEKYTQAAPDLWLVVDGFTAPLVKAEAMMALGKIRAATYLPQVIRVLESTNAAPTTDRLNGERIAFGAIIALEKYADASGYLPVFFSSIGWYSDRIRSQAAKSLPFISNNPAPYMLEVVKGSAYDYTAKYAALRTIEAARGVDSKEKVSVAVAALSEGWRSATNDVQLRSTLAEMRKMAIGMINRYKSDDEAIYPLLERSYNQGDIDEKRAAVAALASQGTEEAAKRLSGYLMDLNSRNISGGTTQEGNQMVRLIIPAIGQTGQSVGRQALSAVSASGWTNAVIALANNALKQLR